MTKLFGFILIFAISIPIALLRGLVLSDIIRWFTPYDIGVIRAIGLTFIAAMFTAHLKTSAEPAKPGESWWEPASTQMAHSILLSLMFWGSAYVWSLFL